MTGLVSLVYVSTAWHRLSTVELEYLMTRARERNLRESITGVLLYNDGNFMQYLEGPAEGIERVYAIICADPLHHGIIELMRAPIDEREFGEWSMAFRAVDASALKFPTEHEALLLDKLAPPPLPTAAARVLLSSFIRFGARTGR